MANKIIGINLNGVDYDYEDEETSGKVEENESAIGDLADLETTVKTDLVSAINEVNGKTSAVGDLTNLETTAKTDLVSAINEVNGKAEDNADAIGDLTDLETTAKTNLVSAINEVNGKAEDNADAIGDLADLETMVKTDLVSAINEVNSKPAGLLFIDITDLMRLASNSGWGDPPQLSVCKLSNALGTLTIRTVPLYKNQVGSAGSISYECLNSAELASRLSSIFGSRWDSFTTGQFLYLQKSNARYVEDYRAEDFAMQDITLLITKNSNTSATAKLTMNNSVMITVNAGTHDGDEMLLTADFVY